MFAPYDPDSRRAPMPDLTVRSMQSGDVASVAALWSEREGDGPPPMGRMMRLELALQHPTDRLMVAVGPRSEVFGFGRTSWVRASPTAPDGWYLTGLVVALDARRQGVGRALTEARLNALAAHTEECFFVSNPMNLASIRLHESLGFSRVQQLSTFPGVTFTGGIGLLLRRTLQPTGA